MYQKITVVGYLGGAPEMRYMPDGTAVTNFSVATSRRWTDKASGQPVDETTWFRVSLWGKRAEAANQYLLKGSRVLVEGRLKPDKATGGPATFQRQDGTVGASFEIQATEFQFMSSKAEDAGFAGGQADAVPSGGQAQGGAQEEDEIPF